MSSGTTSIRLPTWLFQAIIGLALTLIVGITSLIYGELVTLNDQHTQLRERIAVVETKETLVQANVERIVGILISGSASR